MVSNKSFDTEKIQVVSQIDNLWVCSQINFNALPHDAAILIPIKSKPTVSRCIHYEPSTFKELAELAKVLDVNLRKELSEFTWRIENLLDSSVKAGQASGGLRKNFVINTIRTCKNKLDSFVGGMPVEVRKNLRNIEMQLTNTEAENRKDAKNTLLSWTPIIWLRLPKKRTEDSKEEWDEDIAFPTSKNLGELCKNLDIYSEIDEQMVHENSVVGGKAGELEITDDIAAVVTVKPIPSLDVNMAQKLSGLKKETKKYFAVGAGALGSQVITNLTRLGIGKWDILDHDILLPHNLGRHALFIEHARFFKAGALSKQLNSLMDDPDFSKPILYDCLKYEDNISDYDLIFDFSASTAVVSHLAIKSKRPAIISAFMTKNGKYLICLYEGYGKLVRVDDIEYQLASSCISNNELNPVLEIHEEEEIRYSGACSDITTVLPQDRVAVHSGILSSYINREENIDRTEPLISLWELTEDSVVNRHDILPSKVESHKVKSYDVRVSKETIEKMMACRLAKLSMETGGVLIGGIDLYNKIIYIVDIIPSPEDSVEEPYSYIRGFKNLSEKCEKIKNISGRRLNYIGEWHTHKNGISPSQLDILALNEQVAEMSLAGLPAIMIIIGDKGKYKILLKQD
jgi:hypothetical protein